MRRRAGLALLGQAWCCILSWKFDGRRDYRGAGLGEVEGGSAFTGNATSPGRARRDVGSGVMSAECQHSNGGTLLTLGSCKRSLGS